MSTEHNPTDEHSDQTASTPGVLAHVDPATVEIGDNVRDTADLDADFLASITESGVMVPVTATRAADGSIVIRDGQRRTLAAREAGLSTIPVYLLDVDATDTVERITHQIVTNDHRATLTDSQRANGINQLLLAGVSVTKVAKKLAVSRDTVKAAKAVAAAPNAMDALAGGQLSLAEAAASAEFDDDPELLAELFAVAGTGRFEHKVAELRQRREDDKALQEATDRYTQQGYTVLDEPPHYGDTSCVELRYLRTLDGDAATTAHITDPAHWAVYLIEDDIYVDATSGEEVNNDEIDWDCQGYGGVSLDPREGMRHPDSVTEKTVYAPEWYCRDYTAAALALCETLAKRVEALARTTTSGSAAHELDADTDAEARAAAAKEAERRERRKVIALNRLGDAAQTVRQAFIAEKLLSRKTPPKGAAVFVAQCLARDPRLIEEHHGGAITLAMLGSTDIAADTAALPASGDARAQVLTLAMILGALEARTPKDAWRGSAGTYYGYNRSYVGPAQLLTFLSANGYQLADVEKVITGELDADTVYDAALAHAVAAGSADDDEDTAQAS